MAMGNNPMMMVDEDGMTWGIFKGIANAWDWAWDKGNQFARWADENGIPSFSMGIGMNSGGQVNPVINVNGQELDLSGTSASINRGIAYAMSSFTSQRDLVKRKFPVVWADPLIFNGAWTYDPNDWLSSHETLEDVIFREWYKRSSGRVEITDSPIDYLLGAGIGKALVNGGRKIVGKTITKTSMQTLTKAEMALVKGGSANWGGNLWKVGSYKSLRGLEVGLDAHHVGQKALMKRFIPSYNAKARDTRSTAWKAYMAIQRKGDDLVFSDTNGDGKINELDTIAIHQNMLKTHEIAEATATKPFSYKYDDNGNMVYDEYKKLQPTQFA